MADIFQEVDEDLRRDKAAEAWRRYGKLVIVAAALIVVGTASYVGWREYQKQRRIEQSDQFTQALLLATEKKTDQALAAFAGLSDDADAGYATLARFRQAELLLKKGEKEKAVALYREVAAESGTDPLLAGLARLYAVLHRIDTADPAALSEELSPLLAEDSPWRFSARELSAVLAMRKGDTAAARKTFTGLADDQIAPRGIRARASEMLRVLGDG